MRIRACLKLLSPLPAQADGVVRMSLSRSATRKANLPTQAYLDVEDLQEFSKI